MLHKEIRQKLSRSLINSFIQCFMACCVFSLFVFNIQPVSGAKNEVKQNQNANDTISQTNIITSDQNSIEELLQIYLNQYAKDHNLESLMLQDLTIENNRAYAVALVNGGKLTLSSQELEYSRESVGGHSVGVNSIGFVLEQTEDNGWSIKPADQQLAVQEINLPVFFTPQVPPGDWDHTKNCGQTSSAMVYAFYGFYNHTPANSGDIAAINNWLSQRYNDSKYLESNGYYTNTTYLTDLAKSYANYGKTYNASNWTTAQLKQEIQAGRPVIIATLTNMSTSGVKHFMVLRGLRLDSNGNVTHVIVNDPGRSLGSGRGDNVVYDVATFETAWAKNSKAVVVIVADPSTPTPTCSAPTNGFPRDNSVINTNLVPFSWTPPSCDGVDYYTFRVSNRVDIDSQPIIDQRVDKNASSISLNIPSEYNGQTLYWSIRPHNSAGDGSKGGPWSFKIDTSTPPLPPILPTGNWSVQYFRNKELTDQCSTASFDRTFIFQDWGDGAPASGCNSDNWGARITRRVNFQGGNYTFGLKADDWGRIYVDNNLVVDKWNGASQVYEGRTLSPGDHDIRVEFADTAGAAKISAWWWGPGFDVPHEDQDIYQWYANYWINPDWWQDSFAKVNEGTGRLYHEWSSGSPGWDMPSDNFSASFQRRAFFECGLYRFTMDHDDGAKFTLDGSLIVDRSGSIGSYSFDRNISQGEHDLKVEYFENGGSAHISFDWLKLSGCNPSAPSLQAPSSSTSMTWNTDLTLSWYSSSGATQYFGQLQGGPGVENNSGWISGTQWYIGGLWPGVYTWSVTARNDYGSSSPSVTRSFTIQEPPTPQPPSANFDASPRTGTAPLVVAMHIVDINNIESCAWNYGDGQTGTSCNQLHDHTYTSAGAYTVQLSVHGPGGDDSMTRTGYIVVNPTNPVCYSLTNSNNPVGGGSVLANPSPNCPTDGTKYVSGATVQLTGSPNSGYSFSSWSGDASGTSNPTTITMNGNKTVTANFSAIPPSDGRWISEFGYIAGGWRVDRHPRVMGDVNGDGKEDIVGFGDNAVYVSLSTGTSFSPLVLAYREFGYIAGGWRVEQHPRMVADVNGDGKVDLVGFGNAAVWVALNTSTGSTISFGTMTKWINEFGYLAGGWQVDRHPRLLADVNGDGKADVIGFGDAGVYVALSNGSSFGTIQKWSNEFGYISGGWRTEQHPRLVADMNKDGKADLVGFGNSYVYVALSNGSGFGPSSKWLNEFGYIAGGWRVERHPRTSLLARPFCGYVVGFGEMGVYAASSNCSNGFNSIFQIVSGAFGSSTAAGGWMVDRHPRMTADVDGNGFGEIIGFGNGGVYVKPIFYFAADPALPKEIGDSGGNRLNSK